MIPINTSAIPAICVKDTSSPSTQALNMVAAAGSILAMIATWLAWMRLNAQVNRMNANTPGPAASAKALAQAWGGRTNGRGSEGKAYRVKRGRPKREDHHWITKGL